MSEAERQELVKLSGKRTVPQGFVNGVCIGGCNDGSKPWHGIVKLVNSGRLQQAANAPDSAAAERILTGQA